MHLGNEIFNFFVDVIHDSRVHNTDFSFLGIEIVHNQGLVDDLTCGITVKDIDACQLRGGQLECLFLRELLSFPLSRYDPLVHHEAFTFERLSPIVVLLQVIDVFVTGQTLDQLSVSGEVDIDETQDVDHFVGLLIANRVGQVVEDVPDGAGVDAEMVAPEGHIVSKSFELTSLDSRC